jgi:hypothetical protein
VAEKQDLAISLSPRYAQVVAKGGLRQARHLGIQSAESLGEIVAHGIDCLTFVAGRFQQDQILERLDHGLLAGQQIA